MSFAERYLNRHILFEIAPGIVFFAVNAGFGLWWATAAVILASTVFTALGIALEKRAPVFPIVTVALVLILGGATLLLEDETFIKIKPTIGTIAFVCILAFGMRLRPSLLQRALEGQVYLSDRGWRVLTVRWIAFSLSMAIANELVWRTQDTDTWVAFKSLMAPASIVCCVLITRFTAPTYWQAPVIASESVSVGADEG